MCYDFIKSTASLNYYDINNAMCEDLVCLKTNHQIFKRMYDTNTGRWIPYLVDCKTTISIKKHCPDELYEIRSHSNVTICLKISKEVQAYNEEFCYGSNIITPTEIFKLTKFFIKKKINEYWLPTRRMPFKVRLPAKTWRKVLHNKLIQFKNKSDEHCCKHILNNPSMLNSEIVVVAVPCNTFINAVCIFNSELLYSAGCPNGFGALTYRPHDCFGIDWKKKKIQNFPRKMFAKYVTEKKYIYLFKIDYFFGTFGAEYTILMNPFKIIKIVGKGMKWVSALSKQNTEPTNAVKMVLKVDGKTKTLILLAYNRKYLWANKEIHLGVKCFTYSEYGTLKKAKADLVCEKKKQTFSIFQVNLVSKYGTEYYCEGHRILDFQSVSTQLFIAPIPSQGHGFVRRWNVLCIRHDCQNNMCNVLSIDSIVTGKKLRSLIKSRTSNSNLDELVVHCVRIVNVECKTKMFVYLSKNSTALIRNENLCFPERLFSKNDMKNQWVLTRFGKLARTKRICLKKNDMPFSRLCKGDLSGPFWRKLRKLIVCKNTNKITKIFHDLWKSYTHSSSPEIVLNNIKDIITKNKKILVPVDILLISNIIQIALENILENKLYWVTFEGFVKWRNVFADILNTYNSIISIDFSVLRRSAKINATNKLLESFERSVDTISTKLFFIHTDIAEEDFDLEVQSETIDYDDIGVSVHISKYILYFLINPLVANVSGIALFKNKKSGEIHQQLKGAFINEHYRFLQTNHDINDVVKEPNLQLGVYLPNHLLAKLKALSGWLSSANNKSDPIVVVKVYSNDKLFQHSTGSKKLLSRIVSISLPGYSSILPEPLPLILRRTIKNDVNMSGSCQYWNYEYWATDGILTLSQSETKEGVVVCLLRHLAPSAYLIGNNI